MNYEEAHRLYETARNPEAGKPISGNTRLFKTADGYAIRFYDTDIIRIHPDNTYTLATGGYYTRTTKCRINEFAPVRVYQKNKLWYLSTNSLFYEHVRVDSEGKPIISQTPFRRRNQALLKLI